MELKVGFTNQQKKKKKKKHHMLFLLKISILPSILFKILLKLMRLSCQAAHRMLGSLIANFCLLNVLVVLCMGSMRRLLMNVDKRRYLCGVFKEFFMICFLLSKIRNQPLIFVGTVSKDLFKCSEV